jgi:hypothetical protein
VRISGGARVVRGGLATAETALFALFSTTALESSVARSLEVRFFQATGGRWRLGLFSEGQLLGLINEAEAGAASGIRGIVPGRGGIDLVEAVRGGGLSAEQLSAGILTPAADPVIPVIHLGRSTATINALVRNQSLGVLTEVGARQMALQRGEIILETQFHQGAVLRGFDFASFTQGPNGVRLFLAEAKSTPGNVVPSRLTSLGLGRGGAEVFRKNLGEAARRIRTQLPEGELQKAILKALTQNAPIRLVGPHGFRVTQATIQRIQATTGRSVLVETLGQ